MYGTLKKDIFQPSNDFNFIYSYNYLKLNVKKEN